MKNSLLFIFDEIWPETMYYSTGTLARFWSNFKNSQKNPILIRISSNILHNISTCICIRKCNKNEEFFPSHFWQNTLYYSTGTLALFLSNFKKS